MVSTAKWKTTKRCLRRRPEGRRCVFVAFHLAVETMNKKHNGNQFFIKVWPNFWPRIDNRLWVVLALKNNPPPFLFEETIRWPRGLKHNISWGICSNFPEHLLRYTNMVGFSEPGLGYIWLTVSIRLLSQDSRGAAPPLNLGELRPPTPLE